MARLKKWQTNQVNEKHILLVGYRTAINGREFVGRSSIVWLVAMIKLENLNFDYGTDDSTIFRRVNLEFAAGELALIVGPTGSGKSTLLKIVNRLSPVFTGGRLSGRLFVQGLESSLAKPKHLAKLIGYVNQVPESAFVSETVIEELAFGMEQLGTAESEMLEQVAKYAALLKIEELLHCNLEELSAGQQQRVAIAAALTSGQKVLLLDEPTSALDSESTQKLFAALRDLATNHGITVIVTEHRLGQLVDLADSVVLLKGDGSAQKKKSSWEAIFTTFPAWQASGKTGETHSQQEAQTSTALQLESVAVRYPSAQINAVSNVSLEVGSNEIIALVGPNGSGKTTILEAISGLVVYSGSVKLGGHDMSHFKRSSVTKHVSLVPQCASDLLFLATVGKVLRESDAFARVAPNTTSGIFSRLVGRVNPAIHPRDLSIGQQLALVISMQLAVGSPLLSLDEPTRGLDYEAKNELAKQLLAVKSSGKAVLLATHDLEFANQVADRVITLKSGVITNDSELTT